MERSNRLEVTAAASSKKRKVEPEDGNEKLNLGGDGATPKKRSRTRTRSGKARGKARGKTVAAVCQPPLINPSDPCQVLPTELWHQILSLLPLSKVAGLSMVSKTWLDGTRAYPAWKSICDALNLGEPQFHTHMAMVCVRSFFICDKCHSYSDGHDNASEIPLPVPDKDDGDFVWMLCHACRLEYYGRYPENFREATQHDWKKGMIARTEAQDIYYLSVEELDVLHFEMRRYPYSSYSRPEKLYDRYDIQAKALQVYAGWVGVDAITNGIARKRSARFKDRQRYEELMTKVLKRLQKKKDAQQQQQVEGQEPPSSQYNTDGQNQVQASSKDQQRRRGRRVHNRRYYCSQWWNARTKGCG